MRLLLDTHAILWWFMDDPHLSANARAVIAEAANELLVSAAAGYEIAYKQKRGRLPPLPERLSRRLLRDAVEMLPISLEHAEAAGNLPGPHRDPWDRIMIAQAVAEGLTVVTLDKVFGDYGVPVLW